MADKLGIGKRNVMMPGWVKASLWVGGVLLVLLVVMLALGHGPGQHMTMH